MSSFVQILGSAFNSTGGATATAILTASMTPGNSAVAIVTGSGAASFTSIIDSKSNTWVKRKALEGASTGSNGGCAIFDCLSPTALASGDTVRVNCGGTPTRCSIVIGEYVPLSAADASGSSNNTASVTSGSVTASGATTTATEVAIAGLGTVNDSGATSAAGGFTERGSDGGAYAHLADEDLVAIGTPSASFSWTTARAYVAVLQTYTLGAAAPPISSNIVIIHQ